MSADGARDVINDGLAEVQDVKVLKMVKLAEVTLELVTSLHNLAKFLYVRFAVTEG